MITDTKQIVTERQRIETEKKELLSAMSAYSTSETKVPSLKHCSTSRREISTDKYSPKGHTDTENYQNRSKSDRWRHQTNESSR